MKKISSKAIFRGGYLAILFLLVLIVLLFLPHAQTLHAQGAFESNLKVAFIGDSGAAKNSKDVLNLIKQENTGFVVHAGDLDYENDPGLWERYLQSIIGDSYPYFIAEGNHDAAEWAGYKTNIEKRLKKIAGANCTGPVGQMQKCEYRGILLLIVAPNVAGSGHAAYIKRELAASHAKWKICVWHENMKEAQVGRAHGTTGWGVYEECRKGGAIIATGHSHIYSRTKTLVDIPKMVVDPNCKLPNMLCVAAGRTFLFVSGISGRSQRKQKRCLPTTYPYGCKGQWAKIYAAQQNSTPGALFIIFNYNGDPNKAHGYFKNINGQIIDEFDVATGVPAKPPTPTPPVSPTFYCLGLGTEKCQNK